MRESTIERQVTDYAKSQGWLSYKLNGQHDRGKPDRVYIKNGNVIFIEFKAEGKKPTKIQTRTIDKLTQYGFGVHVVDCVEKGKEVFCA